MANGDTPPPFSEERQRWLQEQYTELASLAGGLAHEIKNPLGTIRLNLQLLAEDFGAAETQRERRALQKIEVLQGECKRLEDILNDFLRFARVCDLQFETMDLTPFLREMIEFFAPNAEKNGIVIRNDLRASLPPLRIDRDFFKQAVLNLLLNAVQAMPQGGELILKSRIDDTHVFVDIIDTGPGMSSETLSRIFKPFFSTRSGGSGLGLPTTKKIIEAHHGKLHVASALGKGTAFTIELPYAS